MLKDKDVIRVSLHRREKGRKKGREGKKKRDRDPLVKDRRLLMEDCVCVCVCVCVCLCRKKKEKRKKKG